MEKGWFRTELPSRAITYVFEALVSGADTSFHPQSGKCPKGLGGVCKVTLLSWHLRQTDSCIRHDDFLDRAAKQTCPDIWWWEIIENWQKTEKTAYMAMERRYRHQVRSFTKSSAIDQHNCLLKSQADRPILPPRVMSYDLNIRTLMSVRTNNKQTHFDWIASISKFTSKSKKSRLNP